MAERNDDQEIEELIAKIEHLEHEEGTIVHKSKHLDTAGKTMDMPLKDRIAPNADKAMSRHRLETAKRQEPYDEGDATDEQIEEETQKVVEMYTDDLLKKLI